MIPLPAITTLWKYRRWIAYAALLAALIAAVLWWRGSLLERGRDAGRAEIQAKWDADTQARDAAAAKAVAAARATEDAARQRNEVILHDYVEKLSASTGERDRYYGMLREARGEVRTCTSREATSSVIASTAGEAAIADRIDRAVAAVIVEAGLNADQLDALIAVVKGQM